MLRSALIAAFGACLLAGSAQAELPEPVRRRPACTPAGCSGRSGSPLGLLAGFGLAMLAIAGTARREASERSAAGRLGSGS